MTDNETVTIRAELFYRDAKEARNERVLQSLPSRR